MTLSWFFVFKTICSALIIALVSELVKILPKWAALLTALPLVSFLSIIWIYIENPDYQKLSVYSKDVILWTIPSVFFFVALIFLFKTKLPFVAIMTLATISLGIGVWIFEKFNWLG